MLYIDFNIPDDRLIFSPSARYDAYYEKEWFSDPEVVRVACSIDGLTHDGGDIFEHPLTGRCTGYNLSGGAKTVILAYLGIPADDECLPTSWLGENCFPVLGSLDIKSDVTFAADSYPLIENLHCRFKSRRTGSVISDYYAWRKEKLQYES